MIIDIVVVGLLLGSALYGYQKGLVKMLLSAAASVATILVVLILLPQINALVKTHTDIYPAVEQKLAQQLEDRVKEHLESMEEEGDERTHLIHSLNLPQRLQKILLNDSAPEDGTQEGSESFVLSVSKKMADIVIRAIIFLVTYVAVFLLLRVVCMLTGILDCLPLIREANHLSGLILCEAQALLFIWLVCLAAAAFSATEAGQALNQAIQSSTVLQVLYRYNPFVLFF